MNRLKSIVAVGAGIIAAAIIFATAIFAHESGPIAATFAPSGSFALNAEYPTTFIANVAGKRWASWNGADAKTGVLQSTPFRGPVAVTLDVAGGTSKVNQQIEIVGPDGNDTTSLNTLADAGERYIRVLRLLPPEWWGKQVTLRVTDGGGGPRGWTGVSNLRAAAPMDLLTVLLSLLANEQWAYQLVIVVCFAIAVALAARLSVERKPWSAVDTAFVATLAVSIAWMRWPIVSINSELNPDEALTTANAIKAVHDLIPWRGFDGGTGGPLGSDILALPNIFGITPTMTTTHVIGTLLVIGTAIGLFAAARCMWGGKIASIASLAYVSFEGLTHNTDFVHTSSELLPNALLAAALWALATLLRRPGGTSDVPPAILAGLLIGTMPFAKLQAAPSAVLLTVATLWILIAARQRRAVAAFVSALVLVPIVLIGSVTVVGHFNDFLIPYILANAAYTSSGAGPGPIFLVTGSPDFTRFVYGMLAFLCLIGAAFAVWHARLHAATLSECSFLGVLVLAAVLEALAPNRAFPHYLALISLPASAFAGAAAAAFAGSAARLPFKRSQRANAVLAIGIAAFLVPQLVREVGEQYTLLDLFRVAVPFDDAVAERIDGLVGPGAPIVVWGWEPIYYVHSGTFPATHEASTVLQSFYGPYLDFYQKRFLDDVAASRPALIVDAVAPGGFFMNDPARDGIASFPAFAQIVRTQYRLVGEISGVRFYLRR